MLRGQATKRRWVADGLRAVVITIVLMVAVTHSLDFGRMAELLGSAKLGWLLVAACMVPVQMVLGGTRWQRVATDLGLRLARKRAIAEYALSIGLNAVMPGGMAGDGVRVWRHHQGHGSLGGPLRAAVVDRLIGHWAHLSVTVVGLVAWASVHGGAPPPGSRLLLGLIVLSFCVLWTWPIPGLRRLVADSRVALSSLEQLCIHGLLSFGLMATILAAFWACSMALGLPLGLGVFTAVPLLMLVMVLPLSVGGWGLREVSAAVVLTFVGWSTEEAVALSAAYGLSVMLGALPALVVWFRPVREHA